MSNAALVVAIPEACEALSVGRTTIYELIGAGRLKAVKIGRATRITMDSIRAVATDGADLSAAND
ncbi:MAG: hypothetical protein DI569_15085 [Sphingopyxis macrogoltabida]|uniref:Helix-turn-helix domain-containing protein n=1 Tax=Sphingopyxis macrogoltabida TaxID=33050 RepID=A0A2W5KUC2_SPHMC|nr:MAG: hypothetical protein DI569_15085 [Sphingopyxis macrogoltabida]